MKPTVPVTVTVMMPAHKAAATLNRTLGSIAAAQPQAAEVIVIMDGHDPATLKILENWPSVKLRGFAQSRGTSAARNLGLAETSTPYVMFLDADDSISPGLLGHLAWSASSDNADLAFASHAIETAKGQLTMVEASQRRDAREVMVDWLSGKFVPPCSVLWNADFLRHLGGWDETLAQDQDGDVIHRALYGGASITWSRAGYGIYVKREPSTRVSKILSKQAIASQFQILERIERMNAQSSLLRDAQIGKAWYLLARRLYIRGQKIHAAQALARARALGFKGHAGTPLQRWTSQLMGLERNTELMRRLRRTIQELLKRLPQMVWLQSRLP